MAGKIVIRIDPQNFDPQQIIDDLLRAAQENLDNVVGPHFVEVAKAHVPVSKERKFDAEALRRSSFKPIRVATRDEGRFTTEQLDRLRDLRGLTKRQLADEIRASDLPLLRGTGEFHDRAPDAFEVVRGSPRGAFKHRPGRLRDSIRYAGSRREGNKVIGVAEATAPHAAAIHDGFTHHSHGKATGFVKAPKGPFFTNSLANVEDDLMNASNYKVK